MNSASIRFLCCSFGALCLLSIAHGQVSVRLSVVAENLAGDLSATTSDTAELSGALSRGPGLQAETFFSGFYDATGWSESNSLTLAGNDDYFQLSVSVGSGYSFSPRSLSFYYEEGGNNQGPIRVSLRSSVDNYSSELYLDNNTFNANLHSVDLSSLLDFTGTVNFRWYGYGAGNANGVLGFTNNNGIDADGVPGSIQLEGDLAPVPEPAYLALSMGALCWLLTARRLRNARQTG